MVFHRKARKTTLAINELLRWAKVFGSEIEIDGKKVRTEPKTFWYVSPFYTQTKRIVWDDPQMLSRYLPPDWKKNNSEMTVTAPSGSMIYFLGADNERSLKGPNPYGVIFDEFDDIDINIWQEVVRPVLAMNHGWAWFVGTYKGQGNLYKFFNKGNEDKEWASFLLKASQSGLFTPEELESAKKDLPEAVYKQEMECEAIAGGAMVFKRIEENILNKPLKIAPKRQYQLGVDLAKLNDWTVITPIDLHTWQVGTPERFNQIDYPIQEAKIESEYLRFNKCKVIIDATGIGEVVCDHLDQKEIDIERIKITEEKRKQLLENLAIKLEQGKIKLPADETLITELKAMRYELGENKKIKIISPIHDDCVFSLALAVDGLWNKEREPEGEWIEQFEAPRESWAAERERYNAI